MHFSRHSQGEALSVKQFSALSLLPIRLSVAQTSSFYIFCSKSFGAEAQAHFIKMDFGQPENMTESELQMIVPFTLHIVSGHFALPDM